MFSDFQFVIAREVIPNIMHSAHNYEATGEM